MATTARKLDGPAKLLGRVRQLLQKGRDPQKDLDQMVQAIASSLRADVCSLYLLREEKFELYASKGLKNEAIHKLRLNKKEGLVGYVARSARALNLAEAAAHPSFAFKPETGEEEFSSFLGVPMIRRGTVLGVLVLQNKKALHYPIDEVEALQTVAMVISEIVASLNFPASSKKMRCSRPCHSERRMKKYILPEVLLKGSLWAQLSPSISWPILAPFTLQITQLNVRNWKRGSANLLTGLMK